MTDPISSYKTRAARAEAEERGRLIEVLRARQRQLRNGRPSAPQARGRRLLWIAVIAFVLGAAAAWLLR